MLVSNNLFTVEELIKLDERKNIRFREKSLPYFVGRCLLDVIEYLRTDMKQPCRFSQLVCGHTMRLLLICMRDLNCVDFIQRISADIKNTYLALISHRAENPPFYGDDFWDWAYIIEALATVRDCFSDVVPNEVALCNEVRVFYRSVRDHLESGLIFDGKDEWFGPAVPVAAFRLLSARGKYIENQADLHDALTKLKEQALEPIKNGQYFGRTAAPNYYHWHYGQVVHQFPKDPGRKLTFIRNLNTINNPEFEPYERAWALARIIQGLDKAQDESSRDTAIGMLMDLEQVDRTLGSGLVGGTIKGSLNALEAVWPIASRYPMNMNIIHEMIESLLALYRAANTVGILVAKRNEAEECEVVFRNAGAEVKKQDNGRVVEHENYRVIIEQGKAIIGAFDATKRLIDKHHAKWLITVGIAGSLGRDEQEGDSTIFKGPKKGEVVLASCVAPYRITDKVRETVENVGVPMGGVEWKMIPVDPTLFRIAHTQAMLSDTFKDKYYDGLIVTGTGIKDDLKEKDCILKEYPGALAIEMEGYIVVLLGQSYGIPSIVVRGISDLAQGDKKIQKRSGKTRDKEQRSAARIASELALKIVDALSREW